MTVLYNTAYESATNNKSDEKNNIISGTATLATTIISFKKFKNPIQNNTFFGRKDMINCIHEMLEDEGICIIYGIGGLGKSYCSLKYALEYSDDYKQIQQVIFTTDIKNTLLKIPFNGLDESHLTDDEKLEKRFSILSTFSEDTLLIVDNMDMIPADQNNYERLKKLSLHVIFTTRETQIDAPKFQIPIETLSKEEQLKLFTHYGQFNISSEDLPAYHKIFDMVEGHTLLLELIAKTMAAETLTPQEMMEILYNPEEDNDISKIAIEKDNQYQQEKMNQFVSKLFDTSKLSEPQKEILMKLSLTSITGIRQRIFKKLLSCDNSDINALINQSWIIQNRPGSADSFKIHLHPVIRSAVVKNTLPNIGNNYLFINKIVNFFKEDSGVMSSGDKIDLCDIIANSSEIFSFTIKEIDLVFELAQILWDNLCYDHANKMYLIGISILSKSTPLQIEKLITFYEKAGKSAVRLARYEDAINYYKKAIALIEHKNIDNPQKLVLLYDKLGEVMRKSSNYEQALDYFTKAQNILDIHQIDDPILEANIYNDMGVIYINLDVLDKALENYQKARKIRENISKPDKAQIAYSYHNIGTVYQRQKKYAEAIEWHTKALNIRKEIYPENEPIIAASLTMIGNDYTEAAHDSNSYDYQSAYDYFSKGLKIRQFTLGETHPDTAWSHQSIGKWYFYQKNYDKALEHYQKCFSIRRTFLQPNHAYIADVLYSIGEVYYELNDFEKAKSSLNKALQIQERLNKIRAKERTKLLLSKME